MADITDVQNKSLGYSFVNIYMIVSLHIYCHSDGNHYV